VHQVVKKKDCHYIFEPYSDIHVPDIGWSCCVLAPFCSILETKKDKACQHCPLEKQQLLSKYQV